MASLYYRAIPGNFIIIGKQPDGDSVRFIADEPERFDDLKRAYRIRPSRDGSVQLRFEAIDTPEISFGTGQPLGREARDQLLELIGFENIEFTGNQVEASDPEMVPGTILSQAAETNGRPVSYVLLAEDAERFEDDWVRVDEALLRRTLNVRQLESGAAYYTVYTSTPKSHRQLFREVASEARADNRGVWAEDTTAEFVLEDRDDIGPGGQLILPKLFRRGTDYLKARDNGFRGNLTEWLVENSQGSRNENDRVVINDRMEVSLSDLVLQRNRRVVFQADLLELTFVEK
ncbi:MAG: thermonuclease family protein [Gemmatimonadaceae bacterium]|nr:thermonuclease family protein [Gloeobacterales cyanobacterium ES-bin-141]